MDFVGYVPLKLVFAGGLAVRPCERHLISLFRSKIGVWVAGNAEVVRHVWGT
ncbi:MAG: hypothetical protein R6W90_17565 [Ignavibacteriaceae bacterium]